MGYTIFFLIVIVIFIAVVYTFSVRYRNEKFVAFCRENGLESGEGRYTFFNKFPFRLFDEGNERRGENYFEGTLQGAHFIICDYRYTIVREHYDKNGRRHESRSNYYQTICIIEDANMMLPEMYLRKKRILVDWLGEKFGGKNISFTEDPTFSDIFVLQGSVVDRIRMVFSSRFRKYLLDHEKTFKTIETYDSAFMVNYGKRIPGLSVKELADFTIDVYNYFKQLQQKEVGNDA